MAEDKKEKTDKVVFTYGRLNPPHRGHLKILNAGLRHAKETGADHFLFLSPSHDKDRNPLSHHEKVKFIQKLFPHINVHPKPGKDALDVVKRLAKDYKHVTMYVGGDRYQEMNNLLHKYNNVEYKIPHLSVVNASERETGIGAISATKMRQHVANRDYNSFKEGLPDTTDSLARELYRRTRKGLRLENHAVFVVGGPCSGKDVAIKALLNLNEGFVELPLEKLLKAIRTGSELEELTHPVLVTGNADRTEELLFVNKILENLEFKTSMVFVQVSDEISKQRNDERRAAGLTNLTEEARAEKWHKSSYSLIDYPIKDIWVLHNSQPKEKIEEELIEIKELVKQFLTPSIDELFEQAFSEGSPMAFIDNQVQSPNKKKDADKFKAGTPKSSDNRAIEKKVVAEKTGFLRKYSNRNKPPQPPKPPKPKINWSGAGGTRHPNEPEIRVLSGGSVQEAVQEIEPTEDPKVKKMKGRPKKGLRAPASNYDMRIGVIPSGGIGLTAYTTEGKAFKDVRHTVHWAGQGCGQSGTTTEHPDAVTCHKCKEQMRNTDG